MTKRFLALSREERAALLDAKQTAFLKHLAQALGPDPDGDTLSCFCQERGRAAISHQTDRQGGGPKA
jgi:hypothetical protein